MTDYDLQGIGMTSPRTRNRLVDRLRSAGIADERVLDAIAAVPRHIFIDEALAHLAYEDTALPIGHKQTISQPYIVAAMTAAVLSNGNGGSSGNSGRRGATAVRRGSASPPRKVLEIGTGSGYQTAVLATLVEKVYSVERIGALLDKARERLRALSIRNVSLKHADGNLGWPAAAPFDAVLVAAGASHVPDALMDQMVDGAPLVIPVGSGELQQLKLFERNGDAWRQRTLEDVRFVPLLRGVRS